MCRSSRVSALVACLSALSLLLSPVTAAGQAPAPKGKKKSAEARKRALDDVRVWSTELASPPEYTYEVVGSWPHDPGAFTQGLIFRGGLLYESTGLYGSSSLRRVAPETGAVLRRVDVSANYFAEGLTELGGKLYQLTWQSRKGFIYDFETFAKIGEFSYTGEGWGLTEDGESLIMSDGTNAIRFLDPATFEVRRTIRVFRNGAPLMRLNELEYIDGQIYANIWMTDYIVRIDPISGWLTGWIDLTGLLPPGSGNADVLNGIAYDAENRRILVTGKLWPRIFEIRLKRK